jgi:hypothetical protein
MITYLTDLPVHTQQTDEAIGALLAWTDLPILQESTPISPQAALQLHQPPAHLILRSPAPFVNAANSTLPWGAAYMYRNLLHRLWLRHAAAEAGDQNVVVYGAGPPKAPQSFQAHWPCLFCVPLRL